MSTELQAKVQASPAQSFTPVQTGLLQRQCTLCNTPGLVEDSGRDKEKLTLQRSFIDQAGTTIVPRFGHDFSKVRVHSTGPGMIQTKLKINEPGDIYEQEADRVADAVMRMPEPGVQRDVEPEEEEERLEAKPLAGQITTLAHVQRQEETKEVKAFQTKPLADQITPVVQRQTETVKEEGEEKLSRAKETSGQTPRLNPILQNQIHSLRGGGQPLSKKDRTFFETRFGHDFSQVRVHTDSQAVEAAKSVNAKAFTTGRDIMFGAGQYSPETVTGKRLLSHELTHVVQQNGIPCIRQKERPSPHDKGLFALTKDKIVSLAARQKPSRKVIVASPLVNLQRAQIRNILGRQSLQTSRKKGRLSDYLAQPRTLKRNWRADQLSLMWIEVNSFNAASTYESINKNLIYMDRLKKAGKSIPFPIQALITSNKQMLAQQGKNTIFNIKRLFGKRLRNVLLHGIRSRNKGSTYGQYTKLNRQVHFLWKTFKLVTSYRGGRFLRMLTRKGSLTARITLFFRILNQLVHNFIVYARFFS